MLRAMRAVLGREQPAPATDRRQLGTHLRRRLRPALPSHVLGQGRRREPGGAPDGEGGAGAAAHDGRRAGAVADEVRPGRARAVPGEGEGRARSGVVVGSPLGLKERSASAPLVGREHELSVLVEALDVGTALRGEDRRARRRARDGQVAADRGASRHCWAVSVRSVQCEEYESSTPYFSFRDLLREVSVARTRMIKRPSSGTYESGRVNAPHLLPWLPLLGVPIGLELSDTPETAPLADEFRKARLEEVTRELLGMLLLEATPARLRGRALDGRRLGGSASGADQGLEQRPWLVVVAGATNRQASPRPRTQPPP